MLYLLLACINVQFLKTLNNTSVLAISNHNFYNNGIYTKFSINHHKLILNQIKPVFIYNNFINKNGFSNHKIGVFNYLKDKLDNFLQKQLFVPPVPIGKRSDEIISSGGPLQTDNIDEESYQLLLDLGLNEQANADDVISAMEHQFSILPEDRHEELRKRVDELLRKKFVELFKEFEEKMDQGPEVWRELWDPVKNPDISLESLINEKDLSEEGKRLIRAALRKRKIEAFFYTLDLGGLIRFTDRKLFIQRLHKVQYLMLPVLALSMFERLSPTCTAFQSMIAAKLISEPLESDKNSIDENKIGESNEVLINESPTSARTQRSLSARSMMTSLVVLATSLIGSLISKIIQQIIINFQQLSQFNIPSGIISSISINICMIISSLIIDTSPMSMEKQQIHDIARFEKLPFMGNSKDDSDELITEC